LRWSVTWNMWVIGEILVVVKMGRPNFSK